MPKSSPCSEIGIGMSRVFKSKTIIKFKIYVEFNLNLNLWIRKCVLSAFIIKGSNSLCAKYFISQWNDVIIFQPYLWILYSYHIIGIWKLRKKSIQMPRQQRAPSLLCLKLSLPFSRHWTDCSATASFKWYDCDEKKNAGDVWT